jgi:hypothetical protein
MAVLAAALLLGGEELIYLKYGGDSVEIVRITREGREIGRATLKDARPFGLRVTPRGTILGCNGSREVIEFDREGKVVSRVRYAAGEGYIGTAALLPNGNLLIAGGSLGKRIIEIDREGREVRELKVEIGGSYIRSVVASGDRIVVTAPGEAFEVDWKGRRHFEYKAPGETFYDAAVAPNGNFVIAHSLPRDPDTRARRGKIVEVTRDGKEVWVGSHGCPILVQPMEDGHTLVGGG